VVLPFYPFPTPVRLGDLARILWDEAHGVVLRNSLVGLTPHRAYQEKFRRKVLGLVREKYGGPVGERFGATLAAEHLSSEDGLRVGAETLRSWMLAEGLWSR